MNKTTIRCFYFCSNGKAERMKDDAAYYKGHSDWNFHTLLYLFKSIIHLSYDLKITFLVNKKINYTFKDLCPHTFIADILMAPVSVLAAPLPIQSLANNLEEAEDGPP